MSTTSKTKAYAAAGVDIALAERLLRDVKPHLRKASRPEVLGGIGSFGGLFEMSRMTKQLKRPVLVSSTDGVGTKLKAATWANKHDGVGHDISNHCMNDIAVMGAEPLFFLDYFACNSLDGSIYRAVLKGVAEACRKGNCALIGGETCELPGVYAPGEYDLVGTIVGCVDRSQIVTGEAIRPGDCILGVSSNGLHTNGYSLARRIVIDQLGMSPTDVIPGTRTQIGKALLKPHLNYAQLIVELRRTLNKGSNAASRAGNQVLGFAHITGGGITGNLPRILPDGTSASIATRSWKIPPLFQFLMNEGKVDFEEAYQVWNMGIGLAVVVRADAVIAVGERIARSGHRACMIGQILKGGQGVRLQQ